MTNEVREVCKHCGKELQFIDKHKAKDPPTNEQREISKKSNLVVKFRGLLPDLLRTIDLFDKLLP